MAKEKKPRKQRVTAAEKIAKMNPAELSKIPGTAEGMKQLAKYYNTLRQGFNRRMTQIRKAGKYSFAGEQIAETVINKPASAITSKFKGPKAIKRGRNALIGEIAKYQQFFQSQTATLAGIYEVQQEQYKRIFADMPDVGQLTEDEWIEYWKVYGEYIHSGAEPLSKYYSKTVQQTLASAMFQRNTPELLEKARRYGIETDLGTRMRDTMSYNLAKVDLMLRIRSIEQAMGEEDELDLLSRDRD